MLYNSLLYTLSIKSWIILVLQKNNNQNGLQKGTKHKELSVSNMVAFW